MAQPKLSTEQIKSAASESLQRGGDIRDRVRDLTLRVLTDRRFEPGQVREVVRAMTEGISLGATKRSGDLRRALSQALSGLDDALMISAEASHLALQELASKARELNDSEVKQAITDLKRMEEDFLSTVEKAADGAEDKVKAELHDLVAHARRTGTDTGTKVAAVLREFSSSMGTIMLDSAKAGLGTTRELSARFTEVASGILAGMADALRHQGQRTREK